MKISIIYRGILIVPIKQAAGTIRNCILDGWVSLQAYSATQAVVVYRRDNNTLGIILGLPLDNGCHGKDFMGT